MHQPATINSITAIHWTLLPTLKAPVIVIWPASEFRGQNRINSAIGHFNDHFGIDTFDTSERLLDDDAKPERIIPPESISKKLSRSNVFSQIDQTRPPSRL